MMRCIRAKFKSPRARVSSSRNERFRLSQNSSHPPRAQSDGIKSVDLKSPNELTEEEYNSYSGAAIGGTLLLLVPIAYLDELLFAIVKDFAIAAILGGGAGAYLSLRSDSAGEAANKFGAGLLGLVDKVLD